MEELSSEDLLGKYFGEYDDIDLLSEHKYYNYYIALSKKDKKLYILKAYLKKRLEKGEIDYLKAQIDFEIKILNKIKSKNIITKYSDFETDHAYILVLENYRQNLKQYIQEKGTLHNEQKIFQKLIIDLGNALKILKNNEIIHRNINPYNIIVQKNGEDIIFKLANFNSAVNKNENDFEQIGNFLYAAPEINRNEIYDEKCDIWSIGIVLYYTFFGESPYGEDLSKNIINSIIYKNDFEFELSNVKVLDDFFKKLLVINPDNRMSYNEFIKYIQNIDFQNQILKIEYEPKKKKYLNENYDSKGKEIDAEAIFNKVINYVNEKQIFDINEVGNNNINDLNKKNNNIIYYNNNITYLDDVLKESANFEKNTNGVFLLCMDEISLKLILKEIQIKYKRDKRVVFNLIVNGQSSEKIMQILNKDKINENIIKNICIFCGRIREEYYKLKEKYPKINLVANNEQNIINFIETTSDKEIKRFDFTKLVTYNEYKKYYFLIHKKISKFYGNISKEEFKNQYIKIENFIDNNQNLNQDKEFIKQGLLNFEIIDDLKFLDKMIIREYTKETIYKDLNQWLIKNKPQNTDDSFEPVAYFTSRLMYSLNSYASDKKKFYNQNDTFIFRGIKLFYSDLISYLRVKNQIIVFTSFTSTTEDAIKADDWSGRRRSKIDYEGKLFFSVVITIKNLWKKGWISNGINIQDISKVPSEKEILFQPFSFYWVTDVEINTENYTAEISLETIGKKEILEKEIKKGKEIIYDSEENIMNKINTKFSDKKSSCFIY